MKELLKKFMHAYAHADTELLGSMLDESTELKSNMVGNAKGKEIIKKLKLPMENVNVTVVTLTNYLEQGTYCIATFHHLHAMDYEQSLYPYLYGGKISLKVSNGVLRRICMDLEYEYGNTYFLKDSWNSYEVCKGNRTVRNEGLNGMCTSAIEAVYKCFLAMDIMDENLLKNNLKEDVKIERVGVDGDVYSVNGIQGIKEFMQKDKTYYDQNQYSLHLHEVKEYDETHTHISAWHLSPGKPGNKHIASHMKFAQFYNEIIEMDVVKQDSNYKVENIVFKRKENPVVYGYDFIEL